MDDGLTYEQLQAMGAKPSGGPAPADEGLTFEQLQQMGAKPSAPAPAAPPEMSRGERVGQGMAAVNSGVDRMLFGIPSMLLRGAAKIDHATGMEEPGWAENAANGIEEYRNRNPRLSTATDMPGMVAPGSGPAALAKGIDRLIPQGATPMARMGRHVLTGAGTNAAISEAESAMKGSSMGEAAGQAAGSAVAGGFLGGGFGLMGEAASKLLNGKGAKAREFIEREGQGAKVGVTSAGKGGVYDEQLKGVPINDKGIGNAGLKGSRNIVDKLENDFGKDTGFDGEYRTSPGKYKTQAAGEARERVREVRDQAHGPAEQELDAVDEALRENVQKPFKAMRHLANSKASTAPPRDLSDIAVRMSDAASDLETAPATRAKLIDRLGVLEAYRDPKTQKILVPERQVNGLRRSLNRMAGYSKTDVRGEESAPLRDAAAGVRKMVDEGPYAESNKFYAEGMAEHESYRKGLGLKKRQPADRAVDVSKIARKRTSEQATRINSERDQQVSNFTNAKESAKRPREQLGLDTEDWRRKTDVNQVRLALERQGQETNTAGGNQADLGTFRAENPESRLDTFLPELVRNKADISYGIMPKHGGLIPRLKGPGNALLHMLIPAITGAASHSPGMTAAAAATSLALLNKTPIAARLLYNPALMAEAASKLPKSLLFQAARKGNE